MKTVVQKIYVFIFFSLYYAWEVIVTNFRLGFDILFGHAKLKAGILVIPFSDLTDRQVLMLSILITMTPGTLCLETDSNKKTIFIHTLYLDDHARNLHDTIKKRYEPSIRVLF